VLAMIDFFERSWLLASRIRAEAGPRMRLFMLELLAIRTKFSLRARSAHALSKPFVS